MNSYVSNNPSNRSIQNNNNLSNCSSEFRELNKAIIKKIHERGDNTNNDSVTPNMSSSSVTNGISSFGAFDSTWWRPEKNLEVIDMRETVVQRKDSSLEASDKNLRWDWGNSKWKGDKANIEYNRKENERNYNNYNGISNNNNTITMNVKEERKNNENDKRNTYGSKSMNVNINNNIDDLNNSLNNMKGLSQSLNNNISKINLNNLNNSDKPRKIKNIDINNTYSEEKEYAKKSNYAGDEYIIPNNTNYYDIPNSLETQQNHKNSFTPLSLDNQYNFIKKDEYNLTNLDSSNYRRKSLFFGKSNDSNNNDYNNQYNNQYNQFDKYDNNNMYSQNNPYMYYTNQGNSNMYMNKNNNQLDPINYYGNNMMVNKGNSLLNYYNTYTPLNKNSDIFRGNIDNNNEFGQYKNPMYNNNQFSDMNVGNIPYQINNNIYNNYYMFPENGKKNSKNQGNNKYNMKESNTNVKSETKKAKKHKKKGFHGAIESNLFVINLDNIIRGVELRTSLMIRNIPNKYTADALLKEINQISKNCYDFFYLPLDDENNCNLGYAFIDFIDPLYIVRFFLYFKDRKWDRFNSLKKCDLTFAKFQGEKELTSQLSNNMRSVEESKMPKLFKVKEPGDILIPKSFYDLMKKYKPQMIDKVKWI